MPLDKAAPIHPATDASIAAKQSQALILKGGKSPHHDGEKKRYARREWDLYFFFRIVPDEEAKAYDRRFLDFVREHAHDDRAPILKSIAGGACSHLRSETCAREMALAVARPSHLNSGVVEISDKEHDGPLDRFRGWLNILVHEDKKLAHEVAALLGEALASVDSAPDGAEAHIPLEAGARAAVEFGKWLGLPKMLAVDAAKDVDLYEILNRAGGELFPADGKAPESPLLRMVGYEMMRQLAPAAAGRGQPLIRGEADATVIEEEPEEFDRSPITLAFTFSGLQALQIDAETLASFPDCFTEGMAARAPRLRDTGASAPEHWEGVLGLRSVHGFFTGGSNLHNAKPTDEAFWKKLRGEIRAFNDPCDKEGRELRTWVGLLSRIAGLEILHIELGQDPYGLTDDRKVESLGRQFEHFGFRDGLSQPFVDLALAGPKAGGGTPSRQRTWSPVAAGEIFLDDVDEDGDRHLIPNNKTLRSDSTYLVVRKLEQDVQGFRAFLAQHRPGDEDGQELLAAQLVGRWKDGTPLIHAPARAKSEADENTINDFRFAADDPLGQKCPLSAHIRRANPRDTGGRNDVRHHRILRRGMAYGGHLLQDREPDDGGKRGLIFIAACARIDTQFEVIQGDWLNGGEFLGQAGLARCPLTGTQAPDGSGSFLEAGAVAPIVGLPNFVTMRGGDYFFAPGVEAVRAMTKDGETFRPDKAGRGLRMGNPVTPGLFTEQRLKAYGRRLVGGKESVIRVRARRSAPSLDPSAGPETVAFVGKHADVKDVLSNARVGNTVHFSVCPYREAGKRLTRGDDFPVGTDDGDPARTRLFEVLNSAWTTLSANPKHGVAQIPSIAKDRLRVALRQAQGGRNLDLVADLATPAAYDVVKDILGVPGPKWLTEIAAALPFARQHIGDLPPDWLAAVKGERPSNPGLATMQVWMALIVADLIGNIANRRELQALARQAGLEALNHIDQTLLLTVARMREETEPKGPQTLVEAFITNAAILPSIKALYVKGAGKRSRLEKTWTQLYFRDVAIILLELVGAAMTIVPLTFTSVMTSLLNYRIDLSMLLPMLGPDEVDKLILEAERLNPNVPYRPRLCTARKKIGDVGDVIDRGDFVVALVGAANKDRLAFGENPEILSLQHPEENYLLFGVKGSAKTCWGRDRVALPILRECLYACARLQGLRRVAGPRGAIRELVGIKVGLPARFTSLLPHDVPRGT